MSDENQAQERSSVVVYQYGRGLRWFLLLGSAAFIAALVWLLFSDRPSRSDSLGGWFVSIVILGGSILFFGLGMLVGLCLLIRQKPMLRLDSRGFECAQGSVRWSEVERVVEVLRSADGWPMPSLLFLLELGSTPSPPTGVYLGSRGRVGGWINTRGGLRGMRRPGAWIRGKYGLPDLPSPALEVSIWACRAQVMAAIGLFYAGTVRTVPLEALASEFAHD